MDETDSPDDRRAAGSWVLPTANLRRQRNHEAAKSGIPKRKKTKTYPRLSCKIEYLLTSNHSDGSIASEFFTGDYLEPRPRNNERIILDRLVEVLERPDLLVAVNRMQRGCRALARRFARIRASPQQV